MHQERCVDQLCDFCQVPLARQQKIKIKIKISILKGDLTAQWLFDRNLFIVFVLLKYAGLSSLKRAYRCADHKGINQNNSDKKKEKHLFSQ